MSKFSLTAKTKELKKGKRNKLKFWLKTLLREPA
jgi:hypothetical protein